MRDVATQPLISDHADEDNIHEARSSDGRTEHEADESTLVTPGVFIWGLTVCAGISGLLFGYDTGVISSTLISINNDLSHRALTTLDKSLITSATSFFALLISPVSGVLADTLGRRTIMLIADILFILGALVQAYSSTVAFMMVGRSVVGAAVGSASFVVPLYISESAPSAFRGRLVTVSSLFITGGQVVAYVVGWLFSARVGGWRWMVGLGALPACVQFFILFALPETPRYLCKKGRKEQARRVLMEVYGGAKGVVDGVLRKVEREILEEEDLMNGRARGASVKSGWMSRFSTMQDSFTQLVSVGGNRRALTIACMLQGSQQLCGFNSIMYFSATIFSILGYQSPTLTSLSIALTNFLFTLAAFRSIDTLGRRKILLSSIPIMAVGLALCAVAFSFIPLTDPLGSSSTTTPPAQNTKTWPLVILLAMTLYVAAYALGLGCIPWQQSELFPLSVRAVGSALATATNWGANTLVGLTFLPLMDAVSPAGTFALYACVCGACWVAVWRVYPETAGLGLEDVRGLLSVGYGVEESLRRFKERKGMGEGR